MKRTRAIPLYLLLLGLLLAGCGLLPGSDKLNGSAWQLTSLAGSPPIEGSTPTMEFSEGQVGGRSGCNLYGGSYEVSGKRISVDQLGGTEMACMGNGVMEQEQRFLELLMKAQTFSVSADRLEITTAEGGVLVFAPLGE